MRVAILTVSDGVHAGHRQDKSGDQIASWVAARGYTAAGRETVPDENLAIVRHLISWADSGSVDLVLTTGGTGLTPRDLTPEATRTVLEREAPGIAEALRMSVYSRFPRSALSRGVAGVRGSTLIINLPGSPGGVKDGLEVLDQWIEHAVDLVRGRNTAHG